jgi:OmpA-OmpF porin, OOP family
MFFADAAGHDSSLGGSDMKLTALTLAATSLVLAFAASADERPNEAFVGSSATARVVTDSYGNCVRTSSWSPDKAIEGCGRAVTPAPVATAVPQPRSTAVTPPPPPPTLAVAALPPPVRAVSLQSDALFAFGSANFKREGQPDDLEKFAQRARNLSSLEVVQIVGHTDNVGPSSYNQRLSEQRADSIKVYLVKSGVDPAKIAIVGVGERLPLADNATREGRARNRRVEIMFKGMEPSR